MATIDDAVYSLLKTNSGLAALVSERIYPDKLPRGVAYPALVYQEISMTPTYNQEGDSHLDTSRFQFDCYAITRTAARGLADTLRALMSGARTSDQGVLIHSSFLVNALSSYEDALNAWRYIVDYMVTYSD